MKCNFIHIKLKHQNNITLENKIFELSLGNNLTNLNYSFISSNHNLEINYYKNYTTTNCGKMIYKNNVKEIKIFNKIFIIKNRNRAKIIKNNKLIKLKESFVNQRNNLRIKIKFLDNIINLNSMFKNCISLYSVLNFHSFNTNYLKKIYDLFYRCSSLSYIDDISNWKIDKINDTPISKFSQKMSYLSKVRQLNF